MSTTEAAAATSIPKATFSATESVAWVAVSIGFFALFNFLFVTRILERIDSLRAHSSTWRIRNTFISWTHALVASCLVLANLWQTPALLTDMINASSKLAYVSICVSSGYFVYDAVDIVASNYRTGVSTQSREVLIHHVLIVSIFSVPLALNTFVGYTILALSIEFNTIWLHLRFMIAFNPHNRATTAFTCVSLTNLATFVVFRLLTLCYMTRWLLLNRLRIDLIWVSIGSFGLLVMFVINVLLLNRLVQSDLINGLLGRAGSSNKQHDKSTTHTSSSSSSSSSTPVKHVANGRNGKHD